jgi:hypothetical protein
VIFVLVIGYAFYLYLRQNKELTARLRQSRAFRFLVKAWDWLSGRLRGFNQVVAAVVSAGVGRLRAIFRPEQNETPWTFFNPRKLPPRQRVQFYYLAMVRRSGENGVPRRIYQTPKEYALALKKELPETDESLAEITQDFIEARYTRHEISVQQVDRVKKAWEAIRRALQERAKRMK